MMGSDVPPLVAYLGELWPHYRAPAGTEAYGLRVQAWLDVLGDLDADAVRAAVAAMAEREYAPTPGQVRAAVLAMAGTPLPDWDEYWAWVRQVAGRASLYRLADAPPFTCPWPELEGLVTLDDLMDGAVVVDEADLNNVRQGHLRRRFVARVERQGRDTYGQVPALAAYLQAHPRMGPGDEPRQLLPADG